MSPSTLRQRSLDRKLAAVAAGEYTPDHFVIADAKDADMAWGLAAAGPRPGGPGRGHGPGRYRTREEYLASMRALVVQGELDIMLTSASNGEWLAGNGSLAGSPITLAVRGNDTTDIWRPRGSDYGSSPSRPFRSARLGAVRPFCDLVLYSVTLNNDLRRDVATLEAFGAFREEAAAVGMRYFLEVFNPNAPHEVDPDDVGAFVNDSIGRMLAGVTSAERPLFLKIPYNGAAAVAELAEHDPSIVVGVLGGSAGTTRDTFELLSRAQDAGARVALFGRKIQQAESQLDLVALMRPVLRGDLTPADAVRAYHEAVHVAGLVAARDLAADLQVTEPALTAE